MNKRMQLRISPGLIVVTFLVAMTLLLGAVSDILLPFVVAMLVAYFLDPLADRLEVIGCSRTLATSIIVVVFFVVMVGTLSLLLPPLYQEFLGFIDHIPSMIKTLQDSITPLLGQVAQFLPQDQVQIQDQLQKAAENGALSVTSQIAVVLRDWLIGLWQSSMAVVNVLSLVFLTPILAFYFLRDWDRMMALVESYLPRLQAATVKQQVRLMDRAVASWVRGQTIVCIILGGYYAGALGLYGLEFALVIGVVTGVLAFIPYVGSLVGLTASLGVAWFQFGSVDDVLAVLAIFLAGQFVEGNFLTPRIVGKNVGLHPVWVIFGMMAGASLFGFVGILLAVPVSAVIAVLVRFFMQRYQQSELYAGVPVKKRSGRAINVQKKRK